MGGWRGDQAASGTRKKKLTGLQFFSSSSFFLSLLHFGRSVALIWLLLRVRLLIVSRFFFWLFVFKPRGSVVQLTEFFRLYSSGFFFFSKVFFCFITSHISFDLLCLLRLLGQFLFFFYSRYYCSYTSEILHGLVKEGKQTGGGARWN